MTGAPTETDSASDLEARTRFEAGELAYAAGRFEDALVDFRRAYELSGRDSLLYNIGLALERLRFDEEAIDAFERFVAAHPTHARGDAVRRRLDRLRQQVAADALPSPQGTVAEPASPSRAGPIAMSIGGVVVAGVGAVLLGLALADRNEIEGMSPRPWTEVEGQVESIPRRSAAGIVLLAVGGVALVGSVVWRVRTPNRRTEIALRLGGVGLTHAF